MIFINDKQVSLSEIRAHRANDKVMNMLRRNLDYIEKRMRAPNEDYTQSISLIWTSGKRKFNNSSGFKEGKKMVGILLNHTINTPQGTKNVRWCESAQVGQGGVMKYSPPRNKFKKVQIFTYDRVEELLWLITFSPKIRLEMDDGEIFNPNAPITVENIGLDQRRISVDRKRKGTLNAYINSDLSPLSEEMLRTLAAAWGVTKATDTSVAIEQIRNQFEDKVMMAENKRDPRYNIDAFMEAVKENNQFIQTQVMINRALDHKLIEWDVRGLRWIYIDDANHDITEICRVPVSERSRKRDYLADYLIRNRKEFIRLTEQVEYAGAQKQERMTGNAQPEPSIQEPAEAVDVHELTAKIRAQLMEEMKDEKAEVKEVIPPPPPVNVSENPGWMNDEIGEWIDDITLDYTPDTNFGEMTHSERIAAGKVLGVKVAGRKKADVISDLNKAVQ